MKQIFFLSLYITSFFSLYSMQEIDKEKIKSAIEQRLQQIEGKNSGPRKME